MSSRNFKNLERLQEQQNLAPVGVEEMTGGCNSFVTVPKHNGILQFCLDPARLNQTHIRPIHKAPNTK